MNRPTCDNDCTRMGYRPGFGGVTYDALTENGKAIYDNLVSKLER